MEEASFLVISGPFYGDFWSSFMMIFAPFFGPFCWSPELVIFGLLCR
jgi:hypothetical protein